MPRNTLLDQRNKIEPWEEDGQEKEEVSKTLKNLRMKFDNVHKTVTERSEELERLKRELQKTTEEELFLMESN